MPRTTFKNDVHVTGRLSSGTFATTSQVALTANTTVNANTHGDRLMTLSASAGMMVTLPAATGSGTVYRFVVITNLSSGNYAFQVTGNDTMVGQVTITLAAGGTTFGESAGGTDDTLTLNGTTSGGIVGSYVEFTDFRADLWLLNARLLGSGTLATTGLLSANV